MMGPMSAKFSSIPFVANLVRLAAVSACLVVESEEDSLRAKSVTWRCLLAPVCRWVVRVTRKGNCICLLQRYERAAWDGQSMGGNNEQGTAMARLR